MLQLPECADERRPKVVKLKNKKEFTGIIFEETAECYSTVLNSVLPKFMSFLKPQNVNLFGNRVIADTIS